MWQHLFDALDAQRRPQRVYAGSTANFESDAFERRFRDIHAVTRQIQARHNQLETVGQYLLGLTDDAGNY